MSAQNAQNADTAWDDAIPFEARQVMQQRIWERCISPADNEWTTWTDAILLAECAATALWQAGYRVVRIDGADPGGTMGE